MTQKRQRDTAHEDEPESVTTDAAGLVPDSNGDVGFRGGRRPDAGGVGKEPASPEPARPRDTGRQGS